MSNDTDFGGLDEPVLELVLSSDDEFADADPHSLSVEDRRLQRHELRERFLPGVDAGALFALCVAMVSLTSSGLVEVLALNRELVPTAYMAGSSRAPDPLAPFRDVDHLRFLGQGVFAAVAVVIAVLAASNWRAERHARWSRPAAQAALLIGLAGVVIALLGYFDVIGALPTIHRPSLDSVSN